MPRRGELGARALRAAISREMYGIDGRQVRRADRCDEIVNNALMENATGQGLCFQRLEVGVEFGGLESVTYAKRAHCLISQQQELKNATVKSSLRENQARAYRRAFQYPGFRLLWATATMPPRRDRRGK